jgi:serine/threonine-protein kinase
VLLRPGQTFGRYTIEALLGEGGMGSVYRAVDGTLQRPVALKLLRPDIATSGGAERLLREARAAAAIEHANAVTVHDVGEVGDTRYIAMELVVGRSLRAYVGDATVPIATRVRWLTDVARALDAAHARGLVHRDVKPENVMVRDDGAVKVLDFGIAGMLGEAAGAREARTPAANAESWRMSFTFTFTRDGALVGTPRYMAPEQINGDAVDGRADQFAWGVMAYELLSGTPPWLGDSVSVKAVFDILEKDPEPLRTVARDVPLELERIVHRALAKKPEDRYASMSAVVAALEGIGKDLAPRRAWRARVVVGLAIAIAGVGALVGARAFRPPAPIGFVAELPAPLATRMTTMDFWVEPPEIVLHLDAGNGVTMNADRVARVADKSGQNNDAVAGTPAPTLVQNAIAGRPALHFSDGAHLVVRDSPALQLAKKSFFLVIVARHTRKFDPDSSSYNLTNAAGTLFVKTELPVPYRGIAVFANFTRPNPGTGIGIETSYSHFVVTTSTALNDGSFRVFGTRRERQTLDVRVDGVVEASMGGADDDVSAVGQDIGIGAHVVEYGTIQRLEGDIAELVLVRGGTSAHQIQQIERELFAKYGLTPGRRGNTDH